MKALRNNIIFQFLNETETELGTFKETTSFGLELVTTTADASTKKARWAVITSVGPEVKDLYEGDFICIEPLKWTDYFKHNNQKYWKTDEDQILLVSNEMPDISTY